MDTSDRSAVWALALLILAFVLFSGEPDIVDAIRINLMGDGG